MKYSSTIKFDYHSNFSFYYLKVSIYLLNLTPQSQAAAVGADVPDPHAFGNDNIQVDTSTPTYKANRFDNKNAKVTQSKSFQVFMKKYKTPQIRFLALNLAKEKMDVNPDFWRFPSI